MSVMFNYDEEFTGTVYEHKGRRLKNDVKSQAFIKNISTLGQLRGSPAVPQDEL